MPHRKPHWSPYLVLILAAGLAQGCLRNETVTAFGAAAQVWELEQISAPGEHAQQTFAQGTAPRLRFTGQQRLEVLTGCLPLSARNTAPYPWFTLEQSQTSRAPNCTPTKQETRVLDLLQSRTEVEVSGRYLILRAADSVEMVFVSTVKHSAITGDATKGP